MATRSKACLGFVLLLLSGIINEANAAASKKWKVYTEWPFSSAEAKRRQAETAKALGIPVEKTLDLGNGVTLELVLIPAGKFIMGTPEPKEPDWMALEQKIVKAQVILGMGFFVFVAMVTMAVVRSVRQKRRPQMSLRGFIGMIFALSVCVLGVVDWHQGAKGKSAARSEYEAAVSRFKETEDWEKPAHVVTLSKPFYMGKYEVTQEQYSQVMGVNPSRFKGRSHPVGNVSWEEGVAFCKKLGEGLRLPSEAEWEYACRAGVQTTYSDGDREADLSRVGWFENNSGLKPHPVGTKEPNAWGLYDMHGNVMEWCEDDYHNSYNGAPGDGSVWVDSPRDRLRVLRGGSWFIFAQDSRPANRFFDLPGHRDRSHGFRVVVPRTP